MVRSSHCEFTKGKLCLSSLMAFSDRTTDWVEKGRAVDIVYLGFSKAFDTLFHYILIGKLRECGLRVESE